MKPSIANIVFGITFLCSHILGSAQNCEIPIRVISIPQVEDIPDGAVDMLNSRLATAITADGIMASVPYCQFFVTAKFNHITENVVPGPPKQFAVRTSLTLFIGDIEGQQIYSSKTFDLRGVGTSLQRALINSVQSINAKNYSFEQFLKSGRDKIVAYFNNNYSSILAKANKAASMNDYEEALYYACSIPECCTGYTEAYNDIIRIFQSCINNNSELLYSKAYYAWSSLPDSEGALIASNYLSFIEPSSAVYSKAQQLASEIKKTVRGDILFDKQDKYKDSIALKKAYVDAARQIGVAYGSGQKETTTNLLWIK